MTSPIWIDGVLVPFEDAKVHVLTHGLHYGTGCFEGIRAYETGDARTAIFRLHDHIRRLFESAKILHLEVPFPFDTVVEACKEVVASSGLRAAYVRPLLFIGDGSMGVFPAETPTRLAIATWDWGRRFGDDALTRGIRVKISSFCRPHPSSQMTRAKSSGGYATGVLAAREARTAGFDEALLLDTEGFVAEGPGQNIFIVRNGRLKTPPVHCILPGITRDTILHIARDLDLDADEAAFTRDELYVADEAFFCGTAAEVTPIREVDGRAIGTGAVGPVTKRVQAAYFGIVQGLNPRYRDWCESVDRGVPARLNASA